MPHLKQLSPKFRVAQELWLFAILQLFTSLRQNIPLRKWREV